MTDIVSFPSAKSNDPWRQGEPDLYDVMADPLVALVMRRDNLRPDHVWPVLNAARCRLFTRQDVAA